MLTIALFLAPAGDLAEPAVVGTQVQVKEEPTNNYSFLPARKYSPPLFFLPTPQTGSATMKSRQYKFISRLYMCLQLTYNMSWLNVTFRGR